MLNKLLLTLASTQVPKLVRHLLVFLGTFLAAHGFEGDVNSPFELIAGIIVAGVGFLWSVTVKTPVDAAWFEILKNGAEVGARKLVSVLAALAVANGAPASGDLTTEAFLVLFANWFASALTAQKPKG